MTITLNRRSVLTLAAAGLGTTLTGACTGPAEAPPPAAGPVKLMFIRHGEEPNAANGVAGVLPDGSTDPRSLSVRGWSRAGALVRLFDPRDSQGNPTPVRSELVPRLSGLN